jgi:ankyrin repeat protein
MKSILVTTIAAVVLVGCGGPHKDILEAGESGNIEAIKQHLADGADVNAKSKVDLTPLHWAITYNHPETIDLLRKHGGKTGDWLNADKSIHSAARVGHIEAVKHHLAAGTDVNAKDEGGGTPLDWASGKMAELLRKHGAKTGEELKAEGK